MKERIEGLKKKVEGSYPVQLDHYAPVVLSCKLEWAGPQMSKATPGIGAIREAWWSTPKVVPHVGARGISRQTDPHQPRSKPR